MVFHSYFIKVATLLSIWLQLKHKGSSHLLKNFSKLSFFGNFTLPFLIFRKNNSLLLVSVHRVVEHYEVWKDEDPIWIGKWDITAYKCHFVTFLIPYWEMCKTSLTLNTNISGTPKIFSTFKFHLLKQTCKVRVSAKSERVTRGGLLVSLT